MAQKKKQKEEISASKSKPILTIILVVIGIFILGFILSLFVGLSMLIGGYEQAETGNVASIPLHGVIMSGSSGSYFTEDIAGSKTITGMIQAADNDESIEAIIIDINSPGGSPVGSAEIAQAVESTTKPVVAIIHDSGASGAYWVASSCDYIIAHPLSVTGSIGVYGSWLDLTGTMDKYGVSYQRMVSGEHKDAGSAYRSLTLEEERLLQEKLTLTHNYFIDEVAKNRNISREEVIRVADGLYLLGLEAKDAQLVDELGSLQEVTKYLENTHNISVDIVEYESEASLSEILFGAISNHGFSVGTGIGKSLQTKSIPTITT